MGDDKPKGATSGTKWENPNHQLYLYHSNQPDTVFVPQPLVEDNYSTWSQSMTMALTVKNKIGFIDGSIKKPDDKIQKNRSNQITATT